MLWCWVPYVFLLASSRTRRDESSRVICSALSLCDKKEPKSRLFFLAATHCVTHFFSEKQTMSNDSSSNGVDRREDLAQALERYIQDVGQFDFESQPPPEWDLILSASRQNQHERVRGMIEVGNVPASQAMLWAKPAFISVPCGAAWIAWRC